MVAFLYYYVRWHYTQGLIDLYRNWTNFLWFFYHFFSIEILLKTLFQPFQRLGEEYHGGFDLEAFFTTLVVNTLMRIVGAIIRLFVIAIGVVAMVTTIIGGLFFFLAWVFAPLFTLLLVAFGIVFLFR